MNATPHLLLLHGALGSAGQLAPLANSLGKQFRVHTFTFSGHGGRGKLEESFSIEHFSLELEEWLQEQGLPAMPVVGYSMGGYVALYLAARASGHFIQILTLGTKFSWSPESARHEIKRLQPHIIAEKLPQFAQMLADRHHPHDWRLQMQSTANMMLQLGDKPLLTQEVLSKIKIPVTIMRGSEDRMVGEAESRQAAEWLPNAAYKELEGQPHPLEQTDLAMLEKEILHVLLQA